MFVKNNMEKVLKKLMNVKFVQIQNVKAVRMILIYVMSVKILMVLTKKTYVKSARLDQGVFLVY